MNLDLLPREHANHYRTILDPAEQDIAREIMHATGQLPATPKLGHRSGHKPRLHLGDYVSTHAAPPASLHRGLFKGYTDILGNDQWGDCGEAMALHGIEGMHHAAGTIPPPFATPDALSFYTIVGGFDPNAGPPGQNPTDQGTDNNVLVQKWTDVGVTCAADRSTHFIAGSVEIDPTDDAQCMVAICDLAAIFCAWALPITAQGATAWEVIGDGKTGDSAPGSWGYHDTVSMAYSGPTIDTDTWGVWTPVTPHFRNVYQAGFFAVVSRDMLSRRGVSPTGLNWTALLQDLNNL